MHMNLQQLFEIKTKNTIKAIKFVSDLRQVEGFLWVLRVLYLIRQFTTLLSSEHTLDSLETGCKNNMSCSYYKRLLFQ
jgi:hypothetical protein